MFTKQPLFILCLGLGLGLTATGCTQGPVYEINEQVRGTLTLDGKPLANVRIQFVPEPTASQPKLQCPLSTGFTDDKGNFELMCDAGKPGAVIGKQRVVVRAGRDQVSDRDGDPTDPLSAAAKKNGWIPQRFTVASTSSYVLDVTKEQHDYKVELSSK
jgi:hypothetical protein